MRQRLKVWFARATLALTVASPLFLTSLIKVHHSSHFWPYGRVHTGLQGLLAVLSYPVVGGAALVAVLAIVVVGGIFVVTTLKWLWLVSWRKPHAPYSRMLGSMGDENGPPPKTVTYERPDPLVRGRIGSR